MCESFKRGRLNVLLTVEDDFGDISIESTQGRSVVTQIVNIRQEGDLITLEAKNVRKLITAIIEIIEPNKTTLEQKDLMTVTELSLSLAKAINGPWHEPPITYKYSLTELRDVKWDMLSRQEQGVRLAQATSVINYLTKKGVNSLDLLKSE